MPFEVPEGWVWTDIEELFFVTKLAGFEYTDYLTKDTISSNNEVPIVRAQNVRMGHFVENTNEAISEALSQQLERSALTKKCLLMTFIGAGIGDTCIFPALKRCHLAPNVAKIEPYSSKIDLKYALYYLMSDLGQLGIRGISKSTAQPSLSMATIRSLEVALPPLAEQSCIVAEIEKWFSLIDIIENGQNDLQETIKQTKSRILHLAIHGKLVPQDPNDEPAIELLKRINPGFTPCDNEHSEKLPNKWCYCSFKDVFIDITSKPYQILQSQIKDSGKYPVISQSANFIEGYSDENNVFQHKRACIIFGDHTRNVKYIDFDFIVGADGVKILCPKVNEKWAYYSILYASSHIEKKGYSRHFGQIVQFSMILPPFAEQHRIIKKIEELFSVLDNIKNALEV